MRTGVGRLSAGEERVRRQAKGDILEAADEAIEVLGKRRGPART